MEGARQMTEAHIRMQLEASEIPIEGSPAAGLHEDPEALPMLEALPPALDVANEVQQRLEGTGRTELRGATEAPELQRKGVEGLGKGWIQGGTTTS